MRRFARVVLVTAPLLVAVAIAATQAFTGRAERLLRRLVEREVRAAVPGEMVIGDLEIGFLPPRLFLRDVEVRGSRRETIARIAELHAALALGPSLWEGAWIADLRLERPDVLYDDRDPFWRALGIGTMTSVPTAAGKPPFLPRRLEVRDGAVRARIAAAELRVALEGVSVRGDLGGVLQPSLTFAASARGEVSRRDATVRLDRIRTRGEVASDGIRIEEWVLAGAPVRLQGRGTYVRGGIDAEVQADLDLESLFALVPEAGHLGGAGTLRAGVRGSPSRPTVEGTLEAREVRIDDVVFSGRGTLRSEGEEWRLAASGVRMFGGYVNGEASGRIAGGIPYAVHGRFREWEPARFLSLFDAEVPIRGSWSGEAHLEGRLLRDQVAGGGRFVLRERGAELPGEVRFRVAPDDAEVEGSLGPEESRLACRYAVRARSIGGEATLDAAALETFSPFLGIDLTGAGRARATFGGTTADPRVRGDADLPVVVWRNVGLGAVRGSWEISKAGFESPALDLLDGQVVFRGRFGLEPSQPHDWTAGVRALPAERAADVARLVWPGVPPLAGTLEAEVSGAGSPSHPEIGARFRAARLVVAKQPIGDVRGELRGDAGGWGLRAEVSSADLSAAGELAARPDGTLAGRVTSAQTRIESLRPVTERWPALRGRIEADATIGGTIARPEVLATLRLTELAAGRQPLDPATVEAKLAGKRLSVAARAGESARLNGEATLEAPHPFRIEGSWDALDLGPFVAPDSGLEVRTSGEGRLTGDAALPLRSGDVVVTSLAVSRDPLRLQSPAPVRVRIRDGTLEVEEAVLEGEPHRLRLRGRIGPAGAELSAAGTGDLGLVETMVPGVASARGPVEIDVHAVRRGATPWEIFGTGRCREGALDFAFLVGITDLSGEVEFAGRRAELREITGRLGGGEFLIEGGVTERGWDVGWAIRDASLGIPEWLDYRASGNGRLEGGLVRPALRGEIEITQALYDRDIEWTEFLPWFRRQARRSRAQADVPVDVDVHLFADGGVFVDNNLVEAELQGDFRVRGGGASLTWPGRIDVVSGEFTFRRRRFTIDSGSVQFTEARPLDPTLEFRGETTIETGEADYEIQVHVDGTADKPRVHFAADDPSLSENDVVALVTFGRTVAQLQAEGGGIELSEVLALTAGSRAEDVESRIYSLIPLDRIEIQPAFSRTTGTTEPRLSIGKDLTESFRALLGTGLGAERQQDVALEYQITPRISVQGLWESHTKSDAGAFGGDIRFRYPFRTFRQLLPASRSREGAP